MKGRPGGPAAALLVFVAFSAMPCRAQTTSAALTVGWSEFAADAAALDMVGVLVPRQLAASLCYVTVRYASAEEAATSLRRDAQAKLLSARDAVAAARRARDLVALATADAARRTADLATAEAAVAKAEGALAALLEASGRDAQPQLPATTPVALKMSVSDAGGALLKATTDPGATCADKKLAMLVHGSVRMVGSFIAIDAALYLASVGRDIWRATEYAAPDGIDGAVAALARPLAEAMLGRQFSLVRYAVAPVTALLTVDGKDQPGATDLFFAPGTHQAMARAPGFASASVSFEVEPGTDRTVELALEPLDAVGFAVASEPTGALVHVDGMLLGSAPVDVPAAAYPRVGRISMPGYQDVQIIIRPDVILDDRTIPMVPSDGLTFDARFDKAKDRFYRSLGWFVVSLPLPVLSGGLFQTYYATANQYLADNSSSPDPAVVASINARFYGWQAAFWTSTAISAGLAINAVLALIVYIGSAR